MAKPCISEKWNVQESLKHSLLSIQDCSSCKFQGSLSRTSLQIDMQSFVTTKSDWQQKMKKKKKNSPKMRYKVLSSQRRYVVIFALILDKFSHLNNVLATRNPNQWLFLNLIMTFTPKWFSARNPTHVWLCLGYRNRYIELETGNYLNNSLHSKICFHICLVLLHEINWE